MRETNFWNRHRYVKLDLLSDQSLEAIPELQACHSTWCWRLQDGPPSHICASSNTSRQPRPVEESPKRVYASLLPNAGAGWSFLRVSHLSRGRHGSAQAHTAARTTRRLIVMLVDHRLAGDVESTAPSPLRNRLELWRLQPR